MKATAALDLPFSIDVEETEAFEPSVVTVEADLEGGYVDLGIDRASHAPMPPADAIRVALALISAASRLRAEDPNLERLL